MSVYRNLLIANSVEKTVNYGIKIHQSTADPYERVTYIADAEGFTPFTQLGFDTSLNINYPSVSEGYLGCDMGSWANAFFLPRPCLLNKNGTVDCYLDINDINYKEDGTPSNISSTTLNTVDGLYPMMEFPLVWFKQEFDDQDNFYIYASNKQIDDSYKAWAHMDKDGNILDKIYLGMFVTADLKDKNYAGVPHFNSELGRPDFLNPSTIIENCRGVGEDWDDMSFSDNMLVVRLLMLMGKTCDFASTYGTGIYNYSLDVTNNGQYAPSGDMWSKSKGTLFYGYTGYEKFADSNFGLPVMTLGLENFIGRTINFIQGLYNNRSISGAARYDYKLTRSTADGTTVSDYNNTGEGYLAGPLYQDNVTRNTISIKFWNNTDVLMPSPNEDGYLSGIQQGYNSSITPIVWLVDYIYGCYWSYTKYTGVGGYSTFDKTLFPYSLMGPTSYSFAYDEVSSYTWCIRGRLTYKGTGTTTDGDNSGAGAGGWGGGGYPGGWENI